jgi:hypothetical protein
MHKPLIKNVIKMYPKSDFRPENFRNWIQREAFLTMEPEKMASRAFSLRAVEGVRWKVARKS